MAKRFPYSDLELEDVIVLDDIEVHRYLDVSEVTTFRMPETKINLNGHIGFIDVHGNVWNPMFDDQKGAKEDWEAGLLED